MDNPDTETFIEILRSQAASHPGTEAYAFVAEARGGETTDRETYGGLDRGAREVAARLAAVGASGGGRVLLLFPSGLNFIRAFVGCLYAASVAVPAPLPGHTRAQQERVSGILRDAAPSAVLTDAAGLTSVTAWLKESGHGALPVLAVDGKAPAVPPVSLSLPEVTRDTLAFLQYTSGSTGDPKGVRVTHGNLTANLRLIRDTLGMPPGMRFCGWLPAIHDLGLIGQILAMAYVGGSSLIMPPGEFLRRPWRWLQLLSEHRAGVSAAPDFAYALCARTVTDEQLATLDLSSWEIALNGSEPVRPRTLAAFADRFAAAGFAPTALAPAYGLAEATLLVTGKPRGTAPVVATLDGLGTRVSSGPVPGRAPAADRTGTSEDSGASEAHEVVIVDPETSVPLPEGQVGEIWLRGPSVAAGYWGREEESRRVFRAALRLPGGEETGEAAAARGYLRTGDLGTVRRGELFVTGRLKDVIIARGRNLYPNDLEAAVGDLDAQLRGTAVFTAAADPERIVVVQEVARSGSLTRDAAAALVARIQAELVREYGIPVPEVVLTRPGAVRRTTSGKVRRAWMRQLHERGALRPLHEPGRLEASPAPAAR
ncbi:fatty acyl-AMP ligase [Streptomyces sp. NPDC048172]|uniref:fatty acyl-AMP ligase n=1 Tax=Streptomyces sp. NPDC048172 TaxID=3365505 RepID=UPI003713EDD9